MPAFTSLKLKKATTIKRTTEEVELEKVTLKHHDFEKNPQVEQPEMATGVTLSEAEKDIPKKLVKQIETEKQVHAKE